jgi:hypothetical protein
MAPEDYMGAGITKIDGQLPLQDDEGFVSLRMLVPDEVALELHQLELVVVHLGDDLGCPLVAELP